MRDPVERLRLARHDLGRIDRVAGHLLKEIEEAGSDASARRTLVTRLLRVEDHRLRLRRERDRAIQMLRDEATPGDLAVVPDDDVDMLPDIPMPPLGAEDRQTVDTMEDAKLRELTDRAGMRPLPGLQRRR